MVRDLEHRIPFTLTGSTAYFLAQLSYLEIEEQEGVMEALFATVAAHDGQRRKSGQPYAIHPIQVATICSTLKSDAMTIMAALLHDTLEDTDLAPHDIERRFGVAVRQLVEALTKHPAFSTREIHEKLYARSREDVRVAVIKVADYCVNLMGGSQSVFSAPKHREHLDEASGFYLKYLSDIPGFPAELTRLLERILTQSEQEYAERAGSGSSSRTTQSLPDALSPAKSALIKKVANNS